MNCDSISTLIPLYYYGELSPEEEDGVEEHTHRCPECSRAMEQQQILAAALGRREMQPPPLLLEDCRADLLATVHGGVSRMVVPPAPRKGPWRLFLDAMADSFRSLGRIAQPAGAVALVAIGFFAARLTVAPSNSPAAAPADENTFTVVRSIQPDSAGGVQVAFDETRRRVERGRADDPRIRSLILAGAHEDNAAVRWESVDLLRDAEGGEVRDALLNAVLHDSNPGVRLKALERLKPLASDAEVRKTLSRVLLSDANDSVRMQVMDVLVTHRDDYMVGMLQSLVQRERNDGVRLKLEKALREMNASVGTF